MKNPTNRSRRPRSAVAAVALLLTAAACGSEEAALESVPEQSAEPAESEPSSTKPSSTEPSSTETGSSVPDASTALPPVTADFAWPAAVPPVDHYPVTVESCGEPVTFDAAPQRAVVNDDNMIELMFALGLADNMAAYSAAGPRLRLAAFDDDYAAVTSLGDDYFTLEPVLGADPDFVFAGWNYGFNADEINPEILADLGIQSMCWPSHADASTTRWHLPRSRSGTAMCEQSATSSASPSAPKR